MHFEDATQLFGDPLGLWKQLVHLRLVAPLLVQKLLLGLPLLLLGSQTSLLFQMSFLLLLCKQIFSGAL